METDALDQRQQFVMALEGGHWSMTEPRGIFSWKGRPIFLSEPFAGKILRSRKSTTDSGMSWTTAHCSAGSMSEPAVSPAREPRPDGVNHVPGLC